VRGIKKIKRKENMDVNFKGIVTNVFQPAEKDTTYVDLVDLDGNIVKFSTLGVISQADLKAGMQVSYTGKVKTRTDKVGGNYMTLLGSLQKQAAQQ
jgi:hypothetical protein